MYITTMAQYENISGSLESRFIRYAKIDTQSDANSPTCPSTAKQLDLSRLLVQELQQAGITDVQLDENGYVYATLPATSAKTNVPHICFCAHVDTSPDASGTNVKPIVHLNYRGGNIVLPDDERVVLSPDNHPDLQAQLGNDIITASGTTLLGADNKAGVTAIMEAAIFLHNHPEIAHGEIKILFTPDEEIGRGVDKVNLSLLDADYCYTIDGETAGSIEGETFSADGARLDIYGVSTHPGFAKGKMESAIKALGHILCQLPQKSLSPESTSGTQGFIHPTEAGGKVEHAWANFILRDFDDDQLAAHGLLLESIVQEIMKQFPHSTYRLQISQQYRNMRKVLEKHPQVMAIGEEAISRAGMPVIKRSIRGGTDGSRLSFMGLPSPNIFAGEHAFHGKEEWVSIQDMEKSIKTIINIAAIWEERA